MIPSTPSEYYISIFLCSILVFTIGLLIGNDYANRKNVKDRINKTNKEYDTRREEYKTAQLINSIVTMLKDELSKKGK